MVAADAVAPARGVRRLAQADEAERAPLVLTPTLPVVSVAGPLVVSGADRWQDDPNFDFEPVTDPGVPMGLNMEQTDQPTLEARPGPGTVVPKLLTIVGAGWLLWIVWSFSGRLVWSASKSLARWRPRFAPLRAAIPSLLHVE